MTAVCIMLEPGFHSVPPGHVAAVVTHLDMHAPARPLPAPEFPDDISLMLHTSPDVTWYREVFRSVGSAWLWFSRLKMNDAALADILHDPRVEVLSLARAGQDIGLLELDFRTTGEAELAFFGLVPDVIGQGLGRRLMQAAQARAFARPIERLHLHTCTFDSPQALRFYIGAGFSPIRQQIEIAPDPRLSGHLPADAAPHVPVIRR